MRIAIIHPHLGIGGAEKLMLSMAAALIRSGHKVTIYTIDFDEKRCLAETKTRGLVIKSSRNIFPQTVFGGLTVLCMIANMLYLAAQMAFSSYDCFICDMHPVPIPVLQFVDYLRRKNRQYVFYCHFPQKYGEYRGMLRKIYRFPLDIFEGFCYSFCDSIAVNSKFTQGVLLNSFPSLKKPDVVYPVGIDSHKEGNIAKIQNSFFAKFDSGENTMVLSINRFSRLKKIDIAVKAYAALKNEYGHVNLKLVLSGGFDPDFSGNVECLDELIALTKKLNLTFSEYPDSSGNIIALKNFSDAQKATLLSLAKCLFYTPKDEHFGIVPVEAMHAGVPAICANSGGPLESVVDGSTGFLCPQNAAAFAAAANKILSSDELSSKMRIAAKRHAETAFSEAVFDRNVIRLTEGPSAERNRLKSCGKIWLICLLLLISVLFRLF